MVCWGGGSGGWCRDICRYSGCALENEGILLDVGLDGVARFEFSGEEAEGEGVHEVFLDGAFEGAGAELRIPAGAGEPLPGGGGDCEGEVLGFEAILEVSQLKFDDARQLFFGEAVEDDEVVDAVEEFGAEVLAEFGSEGGFHLSAVARGSSALEEEFLDDGRADVAGEDDEGVFEIDGAPLAVGEAAVVEDLEQGVEDVRVGFFDFVEEDDAVRVAADGFAELAAFLVADVAGRRADQPGDGVFFHVFAHVEANEGEFVVEQESGEGAGQFGFADAGWAEEEEGAQGAGGVLETAAGAADGVGDGGDGFRLADDATGEAFLHFDEFLAFAFEHAGDGDAGPGGDDLGDVFGGDLFGEEALAGRGGVQGVFGAGEFFLQFGDATVLDLGGAVEVAGALGLFEFEFGLFELVLEEADGLDGGLLV